MSQITGSPIIILGFGRSGTTWISDIVSKIFGGLILFEPLHPSVTDWSERFSYSTIIDRDNSILLKQYFERVLNKNLLKHWLLRNHLQTRIEESDPHFINLIWKECSVIGFKEIRMNFMIDWLINFHNAKIIFIVRHPLAVIASIKKRTNFWEFGWPSTFEMFIEKTIFNSCYRNHRIHKNKDIVKNARTDIQKIAIMWSITHAIAVPELTKHKLPVFYYEDFYRNPFLYVKAMFNYLGEEQINIHPSYLFTPSMTTLKTIHGLKNMSSKISSKDLSFFWDEVLSLDDIKSIMDIISCFGVHLYPLSPTIAR